MVMELQFQSPFSSEAEFRVVLSAYDPATKQFSLDHVETFYGAKDRMATVDFPIKLRRNTFYRLTILSPTFTPKDLYGSPDTRRLGLAVTNIRLGGRPFENIAVDGAALAFSAPPPSSASAPSSYNFPILS